MAEKDFMLAGQLYRSDEALFGERVRAKKILREYNESDDADVAGREKILKGLLGGVGKNIFIEPPFRCDYGSHIYIGDNFYANYDLIIIDVCDVYIGNFAFFGPRVGIYCAGHPIAASLRNEFWEYGRAVTIGDNVWIGGNTVINPGVTIGNNVVIGSGSIVTKDIPDNVVAAGNPCRVLRAITDDDKRHWENQLQNRSLN